MLTLTWEKLIDQITVNAKVGEALKVILWITKKRDGKWSVITHPSYPSYPSYKIEPKKDKEG